MSNVVSAFIENINQEWQMKVCRQLDATIREAIPDAEARIQYKKPHYLKNGKYAAVFGTAKGWVSFTIFNATSLKAPSEQFEASDSGDRLTIKILENQDVDYAKIGGLLKEAAATIS
ncbi:MAG: DUF1801 domain-containing protein [Anaerolineae bacterium]|nr:DUF1801 domain-containing protein [Anaerolineae bacterium]